ncbi:hypothetical protein EVAR_89732_1 [Eumeta japonica]|uniref:Uncharacterized protein n=1 Tax=Eumeta variegata TaxID=151549 RepID=A0A4C1Y779_EUMVA|nr:hypothetical protein EVAR_89732_1 [Eumeta japonica]
MGRPAKRAAHRAHLTVSRQGVPLIITFDYDNYYTITTLRYAGRSCIGRCAFWNGARARIALAYIATSNLSVLGQSANSSCVHEMFIRPSDRDVLDLLKRLWVWRHGDRERESSRDTKHSIPIPHGRSQEIIETGPHAYWAVIRSDSARNSVGLAPLGRPARTELKTRGYWKKRKVSSYASHPRGCCQLYRMPAIDKEMPSARDSPTEGPLGSPRHENHERFRCGLVPVLNVTVSEVIGHENDLREVLRKKQQMKSMGWAD